MTLQNRVTPFGKIVALPLRGLLMGNRGCLHDDQRQLGKGRWKTKAWVTCRLDFKGRKRSLMTPGQYTELFFLDEATALAAGHRPCCECRRSEYSAFRDAWMKAVGWTGPFKIGDLDARLHADRLDGRAQRRVPAKLGDLPDGAMVTLGDGVAYLWHNGLLRPWSTEGYGVARAGSCEQAVEVLTPATTLAVLHAGYRPALHPTAEAEASTA